MILDKMGSVLNVLYLIVFDTLESGELTMIEGLRLRGSAEIATFFIATFLASFIVRSSNNFMYVPNLAFRVSTSFGFLMQLFLTLF